MDLRIIAGLTIPFLGTALGSAMVFLFKKDMSEGVRKGLTGFAAGVMVAASFWSLLNPALEYAKGMGKIAFLPAAIGFLAGMGFLLLIDVITPHMHMNNEDEKPASTMKNTTKLLLAVTIHNIPEGMTVGVIYASFLAGDGMVSLSAAIALAIGIAIQNVPEGAIVSTPLHAAGMPRGKTFLFGVLSGVVEPLAAIATMLMISFIIPFMPYMLAFAAGAMIYVVVEELIPEMSHGKHSNGGTILFALGFALMMILDVAFA